MGTQELGGACCASQAFQDESGVLPRHSRFPSLVRRSFRATRARLLFINPRSTILVSREELDESRRSDPGWNNAETGPGGESQKPVAAH